MWNQAVRDQDWITGAQMARIQVFVDFRRLLPGGPDLQTLERFAFYDAARSPDLALVIATGDIRTYANLLLTVGVALPAEGS